MSAPIAKGMPYATMIYESLDTMTDHGLLVPAIATEVPVNQTVIVDQQTILKCATDSKNTVLVEKEIQFYIPESDFTWLTFVSEPVEISCQTFGRITIFQVESAPNRGFGEIKPFVLRTALFKSCTHGRNPVYCHQEQMYPSALMTGQGDYGMLLRNHAHLYPGPKSSVSYEFDANETEADILFDWDVQAMSAPLYTDENDGEEEPKELIAHTLPHHLDMMPLRSPAGDDLYCAASIVGPSCLVEGSQWKLREKFPKIDFQAERSPPVWSLKSISKSLTEDIGFRLPDFFQRGIGDTYFSGKMLARLGRILLIDEEIREMCKKASCREVKLPPTANVTSAIDSLRASVEIWINGTAQAPFVFDEAWGGVASCGCLFNEGDCGNAYPNCPAFSDPGLNFGNAYYSEYYQRYDKSGWGKSRSVSDPFEHVAISQMICISITVTIFLVLRLSLTLTHNGDVNSLIKSCCLFVILQIHRKTTSSSLLCVTKTFIRDIAGQAASPRGFTMGETRNPQASPWPRMSPSLCMER